MVRYILHIRQYTTQLLCMPVSPDFLPRGSNILPIKDKSENCSQAINFCKIIYRFSRKKQKFTKYALNIRYSFPFNIIILTLQCSIKLYSRNACSLFAATLFSLLPMALILSLAIHPFCVDIYGLFYTMMWSGAYI